MRAKDPHIARDANSLLLLLRNGVFIGEPIGGALGVAEKRYCGPIRNPLPRWPRRNS